MQSSISSKQCYLLVHSTTSYTLTAVPPQIDLSPSNSAYLPQLWLIQSLQNGHYKIFNFGHDIPLGESKQGIIGVRGDYSKNDSIEWKITEGNGGFIISSVKSKGGVGYLCVQKGKVSLKKLDSAEYTDTWMLEPVTKNQTLNESCIIMNSQNLALDVPGGSKTAGTSLTLYAPHYHANQRWLLYKAGEIFIIKNLNSFLNIDVPGGQYQSERSLCQWHGHGGTNQFWKIEKKEEDKWRIYCWFDAEYEMAWDGNRVFMKKSNQMRWKIEGFVPE